MDRMDETIWCDGCGVEMTWGPVIVATKKYCCQDCADGLKCDCGVRMEIAEDIPGSGSGAVDISNPFNR